MWDTTSTALNDLSRASEATIAAYLGLNDIAHLRRIMWSAPVIHAAFVFETLLKNKQQSSVSSILAASLTDARTRAMFGKDMDDAVEKFKGQGKSDQDDKENPNLLTQNKAQCSTPHANLKTRGTSTTNEHRLTSLRRHWISWPRAANWSRFLHATVTTDDYVDLALPDCQARDNF